MASIRLGSVKSDEAGAAAPTDPLAALLDRYVLWAIDELTTNEARKLEAIAPKLTELWGGDGTWHGALAAAMSFPATMPAAIQERWHHNRGIAAANGQALPSAAFARMFVAANFEVRDER